MNSGVLNQAPARLCVPGVGANYLCGDRPGLRTQTSAAQAPELLDLLLRRGQVRVLFQPIFDISNHSVLGYEALTRGPLGSLLESSDDLFNCAESLGRLIELECLAIRTALNDFVELNLSGLLFLNVTRDALVEGSISKLLASLGSNSARIVLELCETRSGDELTLLAEVLAAQRARGIGLALDDFGVRYSCLRRWMQLLPNFVKVDQQFVLGIHSDPLKQAMLRAVVDIAAVAGCRVIAEGVEVQQDLKTLQQIGVGYAQGYLLGRPSRCPQLMTEI